MAAQHYYAGGAYNLGGTTATATATATATTTATATATPAPTTARFANTAASPSSLYPRHTVQLSGSIVLSASTTGVTVLYRLVNAAGTMVYSHTWSGQTFTATSAQSYSTSWKIPSTLASGSYTFQIMVSDAAGGTVYGVDSQAGAVSVR